MSASLEADWEDVGASSAVSAERPLSVDHAGYVVSIVRVAGALYAFEDRCTHDGEPLADAPIEDTQIICPRHGARFCLRTGEALTPPAYEPLRLFDVRERAGRVELRDPA